MIRLTVDYATFAAARNVFGARLRTFFAEYVENGVTVRFVCVAMAESLPFVYIHDVTARPSAFAADFPAAIRVTDILW